MCADGASRPDPHGDMGLSEPPVQDGTRAIMSDDKTVSKADASVETTPPAPLVKGPEQKPGEIGGPKGPEPTRYGDWEFKGRCSDF